jgi:hypothetical protein
LGYASSLQLKNLLIYIYSGRSRTCREGIMIPPFIFIFLPSIS